MATPASARDEMAAAAALAGAGLRATRQRVAISAELLREPNDVTAQELHARLAGRGVRLGLATVYRTLARLADAGVVDALAHGPEGLCYRWCGRGHHHHFVCARCHGIVELGDCRLGPWLEDVAGEHGFAVTGHRLEVEGLCAACLPVDES